MPTDPAQPEDRRTIAVEIWSDLVCPWCYLGKRRFERALAQFEHSDAVSVQWRSFQLDPTIPPDSAEPTLPRLAAKMGSIDAARAAMGRLVALGAQEGIAYDFERSISVNTFDGHRLTHLADELGLGAPMHEALMHAQLVEGATLNDPDTLVRIGEQVGVPAERARAVLAGDEYADEVRQDIELAAEFGATGVPFFVLNRAYGVSGAQPIETFASALQLAYDNAPAE